MFLTQAYKLSEANPQVHSSHIVPQPILSVPFIHRIPITPTSWLAVGPPRTIPQFMHTIIVVPLPPINVRRAISQFVP